MALSGPRLTGVLSADYFTQLSTLFPIQSGLLPSEKTDANTALHNLAQALANAGGPDIVDEITGHADVVAASHGVMDLNNPIGQPVTGGLQTVAPEIIQGTGSVL